MKKTIITALLTSALVGFAYAAPPATLDPHKHLSGRTAVYVENLEKENREWKARARQALAENELLRKMVMRLNEEAKVDTPKVDTPKVDTPKAKPVKELTPEQKQKALRDNRSAVSIKEEMAAAYTKEFDSNKDGRVSVSERPDRNARAAFLKKMHKKNYPHLYREDGTRTNQPVKKSK